MTEKPKRHVHLFISYSRDDGQIILPIVQLLRVTESKVFLDVDSIAPGERWQEQLEVALARADKVCVFWCLHSRTSEWVEREWRFALRENKKIIPLLLDSTPLALELSEYQYIDFTKFVEGSLHPTKDGYYYPSAPPPPGYSEEEEYNLLANHVVKELIPIIEAD